MAGEMGPAAFMWPPDRTWSAQTDNTAPCGSVAAAGNRTDFPIDGGRIAFVAQDDSYSVQLAVSTLSDPKSNDDFEILWPSQHIVELDEGHTCVPVPNPVAGVTAGTNATLQIVYISDFDEGPNNQTFYACADITYVAAADFTTTIPCFNATEDSGATFNHTEPTSTAEASAEAAARNGGGGLSGGAIAGIVVGVVAGVALLLAGAFFIYREKKKNHRLMRQRDSLHQVKAADVAGKDSTSQPSIQLQNMS